VALAFSHGWDELTRIVPCRYRQEVTVGNGALQLAVASLWLIILCAMLVAAEERSKQAKRFALEPIVYDL
jgi:hypothetical protein